MMKCIDLFSGIGGFRIALEALGHECTHFSEICPEAIKTYLNNFNSSVGDNLGDIRKIKKLPPNDLICGGFPCQSFSLAGKQQGTKTYDGRLAYEIIRLLRVDQSNKVVILENVKNILKVGKDIVNYITDSLEKLGYTVFSGIFNASDFNVPQNRERWILVGWRSSFQFHPEKIKYSPIRSMSEVITIKDNTIINPETYTLLESVKTQPSGLIFSGYIKKKLRAKGTTSNVNSSRNHKQCNRIYSIEGVHPTILSQETAGRYFVSRNNSEVLKLTPLNCYQLMGFPDGFKIDPNQSKAYKQIGNSVCVPMIIEILKCLKSNISLSLIGIAVIN